MKKFLTLLILTLCFLPMGAQKLIVRDFTPLSGDMAAMAKGTSKIDKNGKKAAIVRIYTSLRPNEISFEGDANGIVATETRMGAILLYIPARSQKVKIVHARYEPLEYWYDGDIEAGRVYQMYLTLEGKEVSFITDVDGAPITVDGDTIGVSPTRAYVSYGPHAVKAQLGSMLYEDRISVTPDGEEEFKLHMEDENKKYGDVTVNVPGNAEIYFQNHREGVGTATKHLKDGIYVFETRKKDHDPRTTNINVEAGKELSYDLTPPFPHSGYLELETEPVNGVAIMAGDTVFSESKTMKLNVAQYELRFERKGYFPQTKIYNIVKGMTTYDTIRLERKQYIKPWNIYVGAGATYSTMPGVTARLGGVMHGFELSASYTVGLTRSNGVDWYETATEFFAERVTYRMNSLSAKAGYQFALVERFGITPQAGVLMQTLYGSGTKGNGFTCTNAVGGVNLVYAPIPRLSIFLNPEYAFPILSGGQFATVAKYGGFSEGGFYLSAGVAINLL